MNKNIQQILTILNDGNFHSGSDLGKKLSMTRSAIWKLIKQLEKFGIAVETKTNLGYKITHSLELMDKKLLGKYISAPHKQYLNKTIIFDELPSTNSYLLGQAKTDPNCKECICLAESQTAGRGRLGRRWVSPYARNILLSLLWHFVKEPDELGGLSIAIAVTVVEALKHYGIKQDIKVKWPNDIMWQGCKLAGILIEVSGEAHHAYNTVIGIGLNVNMPEKFGQDIGQSWCDIAQITNTTPQRNKLIGMLIDQLLTTMTIFQKDGLHPFLKKWRDLDISYGQKVTIITPHKKFVGIARGINDKGHFLLEDKSGKLQSFAAGEVTLAKNMIGQQCF
jgi:BirA family transcriptional regulator, biotin operon repressor / biotin---[acetyl-CoA-carboxylase] ligase